MEGDQLSGLANIVQIKGRVVQTLQKKIMEVQAILDQNRLLIMQINHNHASRIPENLSQNVILIRQLNNNIKRVVEVYAELSSSFTKSMEAAPKGMTIGESSGSKKPEEGSSGKKRDRSVN